MRLLNTKSLDLEIFPTNEDIRYAILSHTWREGEVTFADLHQHEKRTEARGWDKIRRSCEIASELGFDYIWVDTCCIDKTSSAELSEAINSMFHWYEKAEVCIAYLDDLTLAAGSAVVDSDFEQCRWFFRGWTLQELIAPPELRFYSKDWNFVGTRTSLKAIIAKTSRVPDMMLEAHVNGQRQRLDNFSVAEKMSWAANRRTTRPEDMSYCLLGIFDINMPLLYGEGQGKAFRRLQEEIIKSTNDDSIYAWSYSEEQSKKQHFWGLLADTPSAFGQHREGFVVKRSRYLARRSNHVATVSNRGLNVEFALAPLLNDKSDTIFIAMLDCDMQKENSSHSLTPAIILQKMSWHSDSEFVRIRPDFLLVQLMNRIILPTADDLAQMRDGLRLPEAVPRQIFVPHSLSTLRAPRGILFHPTVKEQSHSQRPQDSLVVDVLTQPSEWLYFDERSHDGSIASPGQANHDFFDILSSLQRVQSYVLNFKPFSDLGVTEPTQATILGSLELEIKQQSGWNSWHVCLVTGLEPLPPNPFGTPSMYTVPWYAFETKAKVMAGDLDAVLDKKTRRGWHRLLDDMVLRVDFDLESRHSRLYYNAVLKVITPSERYGTTNNSRPST
ncbi:heterokaryon incompatibility protein-domain-containing protein [Trichoderma sp. SZMC 28011]